VLCGSLRRPCFCLPRGYACARLSKQAPPGGAEGIGEMSEHVVAPGPTREDGEDCRSETPSTSNTAQAATSAVAAAPSKLDQDISGLAVVADIRQRIPQGKTVRTRGFSHCTPLRTFAREVTPRF
jgi:hypothetical protein